MRYFLLLFLLPLVSLIPSVMAESDSTDNPGVTPDSPFYFMDVMFDQIRLNMASGSDRANIGLEIADERLSEFNAMVNQNKVSDAEKAEKEHQDILRDISATLSEKEGTDESSTEKELKETIDVESKLHIHKLKVEEVKQKVKERILLNREKLSENENANLDKALSGLDNAVTQIDIKVTEEKTRIKIKFEDDFNKTPTEINSKIVELEDESDRDTQSSMSEHEKELSDNDSQRGSSGTSSNSGSGSSRSGSNSGSD